MGKVYFWESVLWRRVGQCKEWECVGGSPLAVPVGVGVGVGVVGVGVVVARARPRRLRLRLATPALVHAQQQRVVHDGVVGQEARVALHAAPQCARARAAHRQLLLPARCGVTWKSNCFQ